MAELSKLLAFMFKEDKEDILAQYNKMLDEADDEQALLESFGSPTKLAVTISRTYKRSERKLAVEADSKADSANSESTASEHIIVTPVKKEKTAEKPAETDTGLSYADIIEEIRREKAEEEGVEYKPMFFNEPEEAPAEAPEEAPEQAETEDTEPDTAAPEEDTAAEAAGETEDAASEQTEAVPEAEPEGEETAEEESESLPEEETVVEQTNEETAAETRPVPEEAADAAENAADTDENIAPELIFEELENAELAEETVRYKTNVALLILYLIFAIPISTVLLVLALAVMLVLFGCGAALIAAGVEAIAFAFAKLVIFADIMLCAGAVLIAFAAALILLWLGILMLVRGFKGIVSGAVALGRKICVREVAVNE